MGMRFALVGIDAGKLTRRLSRARHQDVSIARGMWGGYVVGMFTERLSLKKPGLFITGTDTGIGKTVASCAMAASLHQRGHRVGVSKPIASGCRHDREGLVNEDAEALAHFARSPHPLDVINPVRYAMPVAPAVAAEHDDRPIDVQAIARSLQRLDHDSDVLIVEGVGGALVPLDATHTVIDLARWVGYPVVIVARAVLGTLNHTAMTAAVLRHAGLTIAGIVINGYDADVAKHEDASVSTNRRWIQAMTQLPILATLPRGEPDTTAPERGQIAPPILEAAHMIDWFTIAGPSITH